MKTHITVRWYSDPSHAWMRISRRDCAWLGILEKISSFSYQSEGGAFLYLEEDCDASLALTAIASKGIGIDYIKEKHTEKDSAVRSLRSYVPTFCRVVMRNDSDLWSKLDQMEDYIKLYVNPNYNIPRPDADYPWNLDNYYEVLDSARDYLKERVGFWVIIDSNKNIIHTNNEEEVSRIVASRFA